MGFFSSLSNLLHDLDQVKASQTQGSSAAGDAVIEKVSENPVLVGTAAVAGAAGLLGATATTGTAIGSLSGAALTNASLAAIGGGALTAGGFGMAGGTTVITAAGTIPGAAVGVAFSSSPHEARMKLIGSRVKISRLLLNMSQDACAKSAGISRTALRNLEEGNDTKLSTLLAVSLAIGLPLQSWFEED